jgi:hypothetical protein
MKAIGFAELTLESLQERVQLTRRGIVAPFWDSFAAPLTETERAALAALVARLSSRPIAPLNEATLWARALYPLLMLAETETIAAWAEVPIRARYPQFVLEGIADGALAYGPDGMAEPPYFVIMEAKRGLEAKNPQPQIYGQLLATARMNHATEAFGAYTVADSWTFVHALVAEPDSDRPALTVTLSPELSERTHAERILSLLKGIVAHQTAP